jgi:hypothetical protein
MKIFTTDTDHYNQKVNFVDDNNVMLGYDTEQSCCESADWFIADHPAKEIIDRKEDDVPELLEWSFDPSYFVKVEPSECEQLDSGGMVIFRITNKEGQAKFVHLYNCHNGYYGHGFTFQVGGKTVQEDCL